MKLREFADPEQQIKLWKLISDSVWHSIKLQAIEQEQKRAISQKRTSKKKPRPTKSTKPKAVNSPKLPSAKKFVSATKSSKQQHKRQKHDPNSVANIQRQLDPLASSDVVKRLTS